MRFYVIFSFCYVLYLTTPISGYSGGAPSSRCDTMLPGHGPEPQKGPSPYKVVVRQTKVEPSGIIEITLTSNSGNDEFKGFLIYIRKEGVTNKAYGEFDKTNDDAKTLDCFDVQNNAMTQKDGHPKSSVTVKWIADPRTVEEGEYQIHTTFVKDKNTYWTNQVHDEVIEVVPPGQAPDEHPDGHHGPHWEQDPKTYCSSMNLNPNADSKIHSDDNPYDINIEKKENVEQSSRIWINATSALDTPIMRLFMQVRRPGSSKMAYGEFVKPAKGAEGMDIVLVDCFGGKRNAVLFTNPKHPESTTSDVSFQWMAPGNETGDFEVVSTILKDENTFWGVVGKDLQTKIKVVPKNKPNPKEQRSKSASTSSTMSFSTTVGLLFVMIFAAASY